MIWRVFLSVLRRGKSPGLWSRSACPLLWGGLILFLALLLSGCDSAPWVSADRLATRGAQTPPAGETVQPAVITETPQLTADPVSAVTPTVTATPLPAAPQADYSIQAQLDFEQRILVVEQVIQAQSPAAEPLGELVLAVEANRLVEVFSLETLTWGDGTPVQHFQLEGPVLRIQPDAPVQPGARIELKIRYSLHLKAMYSYLGWTGRQLNLGDWYPFLPAYDPGTGWLVHNLGNVGEHLVYPAINYRIRLTVAPYERPLIVAASAPGEAVDNVYTYTLGQARGFALSISPDFQVLSATAAGVEIRAYVFAENLEAGKASIEAARDAVTLYSEIYAPYPHPGLAIVEADFFDGMEYSGLFFLGAEYFNAYPGNATSYLVPLSAHETAHQWWYSLVGNDPALQPWLDEAFCTHSEALFYERYYPNLVDWWWNYRIWRFLPTGKVDSTIYDQQEFRPYVDAVYLQGTKFLDAARREMGDEAFLAFFQEYARHYAGRLANTAGALELLHAHSQKDLTPLMEEYFERSGGN